MLAELRCQLDDQRQVLFDQSDRFVARSMIYSNGRPPAVRRHHARKRQTMA